MLWELYVGSELDVGGVASMRRRARDKRPGLDRLLKDATVRKVNMVAARSVDRLGRSLQNLANPTADTCISDQILRPTLTRLARSCSL